MNKTELTDAVAESTGMTKADAARAVDSVLGTITSTLAKASKLALLASEHFWYVIAQHAQDVIHKQVRRFKSLLQKFLHLSLVKH